MSFASTLLIVPLTLHYLGKERYGIWMTLLSIVSVVGISDLGVGNAIVTRVASARAVDDRGEVRRLVSTTVALLLAVSSILTMVLLTSVRVIPWDRLLGIGRTSQYFSDGRTSGSWVLLLFVIRLPFDLAGQVRKGLQEVQINAAFETIAACMQVGMVAIAVWTKASLAVVAVAFSGAPILVAGTNWFSLVRSHPEVLPSVRQVSRRHTGLLLRAGGLFLVLQVAVLVGYSSDNFVAAHVLGSASVTEYAVPAQLAFAALALVGLLSAPLWPAYAEAIALRDDEWVRQRLRKSICETLTAATSLAAGFLVAGRFVVRIWSRGDVVPGWSLLVGLSSWIIVGSFGGATSVLLNALHRVKFQVLCAGAMALSNILLSVLLARVLGVSGIIWGTVLAYTGCVVVPHVFFLRRFLVAQ